MANGKQHVKEQEKAKKTFKQTCPNCLGSKIDRLGNPCHRCDNDGRITITPR